MPVIVHVLKDIVVNEVTLMKTFYTAKGLILTKVYNIIMSIDSSSFPVVFKGKDISINELLLVWCDIYRHVLSRNTFVIKGGE